MRVPRSLQARAAKRAAQRRASEISEAVSSSRQSEEAGLAPTSGYSSTQLARDRWYPHDYRPVVGFTPAPQETR